MTTSGSSPEISGRHALFGFIAFFSIVFLANGVMLYWALATHAGIETRDAYRKGLAYNERIAEADRQRTRGWRDNVTIIPRKQQLQVAMSTSDGTPVTGLIVTAMLGRPATSRFDTPLRLSEAEPGRYIAPMSKLGKGNWLVIVEARQRSGVNARVIYRAKRRLWLKR